MAYPVSVTIVSQLAGRDRLSTALRPILAIPHSILITRWGTASFGSKRTYCCSSTSTHRSRWTSGLG